MSTHPSSEIAWKSDTIAHGIESKEVMPPHIAAIQGDEKRRKAFQAYQGNDEEKKARSRDGQHAAALARLEAPTGCWLAAPLKLPRASSCLSSSNA